MHGIYPYNMGSEGAKLVSRALRVPLIKRERSRFVGSPRKTVINWGCQELPREVNKCRIINDPRKVATVANKISFFRAVTAAKGRDRAFVALNIPRYAITANGAMDWGTDVVVRQNVSSSGGRGASVVQRGGRIPDAPLYTEYIKKEAEFRIHVVGGRVIDATRKVSRAGQEPRNWQIRSYDNGFIFQREGTDTHRGYRKACEQALLAMRAIGLDFGGVDVIYNQRDDRAYVLEINSAPGIEGTTVDRYKEAFMRI